MKRFVLALDLKNDANLITEYEQHHKNIWPEIRNSITESGIFEMEIYRLGTRLFMLMKTTDEFSFEAKAHSDTTNKLLNGKN